MNVPLPMMAKGLARRLYPKCYITQKSAFMCMNRQFNSESSYHEKADDALNKIQDTLEFYFEDNPQLVPNTDINFSSGVLTIGLPHGTWVLNKQTPVSIFYKPLKDIHVCCVFVSLTNTNYCL
jgi:hypothetical protein